MTKLKINREYHFSKIGMNEVQGLRDVLADLLEPIRDVLADTCYWTGVTLNDTEYQSRDGFIPHSHNCGGLDISLVIPKCESYNFDFLKFGEYEHDETLSDSENEENEDAENNEGHNDASLRIWFKFEGINEENEMQFYLYAGGGNNDAPYFRHKYGKTIFESSFKAKTLSELKKIGAKEIKKLSKMMGA
jgi:hypothetical protein